MGRGIDQSCQCRGDTWIVCTPPAGCGKQSRDLIRLRTVFRPLSGQRRDARATKVRAAGSVHSPNSAAKFNIPVMKRSTGRIQNQSASSLFCACKTKYERGDLSLSHAWYGGRIPRNTGYMGALACVGSTPAAPSFVRARSCPKRKAGVNPRLSLCHDAGYSCGMGGRPSSARFLSRAAMDLARRLMISRPA